MAKHDESLKRLYQIKKLVISLVRDFQAPLGLTPEFVKSLDIDNMTLDSTEYFDHDNNKRVGDLVWRIPALEAFGNFVLQLLIELQSTFEPDMVERVVVYAVRCEDRAQQNRKPGDPEIRMRAATIYTGKVPWKGTVVAEPSTDHLPYMPPGYHYGRVLDVKRYPLDDLNPAGAAVAAMRLEQASNPDEATSALYQCFDHHEEDPVRRAFYSRAAVLNWLNKPGGGRVTYKELIAEYQGGTMAEAQKTRFEELMEEGQIQAKRGMLRRMAASLFDAETTEQFAEHLGMIDDPEHLAELGDFIVKHKTAEELLTRARSMGRNA